MKKVALENVTKIFETKTDKGESIRRVCALDNLSLSFYAHELHSILGENGAGKSTLVALLSGLHTPTSGTIVFDSHKYSAIHPRQAVDAGIGFVHQRPILCDDLSIFENIIFHDRKKIVRKKACLNKIKNLAKKSGISLHLTKKVKDASGLEKFYTEYLAALWSKPQFLILDEPASILDSKDYNTFFSMLKQECAKGLSIILITHRISEALQWSDRISVLQKGKLVFSENTQQTKITQEILSNVLLEKDVASNDKPSDIKPNGLISDGLTPIVFSVSSLSAEPKDKDPIYNVNFFIRSHTLSAIYGIEGTSLSSLEDALFGMTPINTGSIQIHNDVLPSKKIQARILRKHGVGYVPSNRSFRASNPELTLFELLCAHRIPRFFGSKQNLIAFAQKLLKQEGIDAPINRKVSTLSGGQLQRLILARELSEKPQILILAEPEWGLDIRSSIVLRKRLLSIADKGTAILVLTENPDSFREKQYFDSIFIMEEGYIL